MWAWCGEPGIILCDGYCHSEILPVCIKTKGNRKLDSIGVAIHGVEIKNADDGEILARCCGTATGYHQTPEKSTETFETDGWVHAGDRGRIDEDGFVYPNGRVKEIFKIRINGSDQRLYLVASKEKNDGYQASL